MEEGSNHPDGRNNVEGSKNPKGSYSPEGCESPEGPNTNPKCPAENPEGCESPKGPNTNPECPAENQESSKNQKGSNNIEGSKTPGGSKKPERFKKPEEFENLPGSKSPEKNLEGSGNLLESKDPKTKRGPKTRGKQSENQEGSKNKRKTMARIKSQVKRPKNKERKRKLVAIFSLSMFVVDVGSDSLVGFDLLNRCHVIAGWTVLGLIWTPGFLFCIMKMLDLEVEVQNKDCLDVIQYCVTSFLLFIFTLPMTFGYLIADIFRQTNNAKE